MRLKRFDAVAKLMQLLEAGCIFFPGCIVIDGKQACVLARFLNRARDDGSGRNVHTVCQTQVTQNNGTATHGAVSTNARAACHTHTASHGSVFTNVHVVADLNEVVELDTVFNDRVLQCTPVNAGVGTDLDIITNAHSTQLLDLDPLPLMGGEAKTIGTDHNTRMHDATRTDGAVFTYRHAGFEHRCGPDHGTAFDHTLRPDAGIVCHHRLRIDHRTRVNSRAAGIRMVPFPELRQSREIKVGVVRQDRCTAGLDLRLKIRMNNDATCRTLGQLGLVTCVAEETDLVCVRGLKRGQ